MEPAPAAPSPALSLSAELFAPEPAPAAESPAPEPLESVPAPLKSVSEPFESVPEPFESVPEPLESVPEPLESVSAPETVPTADPVAAEELAEGSLPIDLEEEPAGKGPELAPMHEFIPKADEFGAPPKELEEARAEAPALDEENLERIARKTIEKIAWEIVPQLAETILREEIEKLVKQKLAE